MAIEKSGYRPGEDIALAIDAAANSFYDRTYSFTIDGTARQLSAADLVGVYEDWITTYTIVSTEDGLAEDDDAGWKLITGKLGDRIQTVGDDNFVTNPQRLTRGIKEGIANSILIKLNQIGTLSETFATMRIAHFAGYTCVVSHRSGETEEIGRASCRERV